MHYFFIVNCILQGAQNSQNFANSEGDTPYIKDSPCTNIKSFTFVGKFTLFENTNSNTTLLKGPSDGPGQIYPPPLGIIITQE